jgi:hypothetical protein
MTRFVYASGAILNLRYVRKFTYGRSKYGTEVYIAVTDDRERYECASNLVEPLLGPVIPAQPGFTLLRYWFSEDILEEVPEDYAKYVDKNIIIAWRIAGLDPEPITVDGEAEGADIVAIQDPAGRIILQGHGCCEDYDAFLHKLREYYAKDITYRRERQAKQQLSIVEGAAQ